MTCARCDSLPHLDLREPHGSLELTVAVPHPLGISIRYRCVACGTAWEYVLDGVSRTTIEFNRLTDTAPAPPA